MENSFEHLFSKILTEQDVSGVILRSGGMLDHTKFFNSIPTEAMRNMLIGDENFMEAHVYLNGEDLVIVILVDSSRQPYRDVNPSHCNLMIEWDHVRYKHDWKIDRLINVYYKWIGESLEIKFEQPHTIYPIDYRMLDEHWTFLGQNTLANTHVTQRNFKLSFINLHDLVQKLPTEDIRHTFLHYKPIDAIHVFTMNGIAFNVQIERVPLKEDLLEQSSLCIRIRPIMKVHGDIKVTDTLQVYFRFCLGHLDLVVIKTSESFENLPIYNF